MATISSILAWEIPWTEEPGGLQSMGLRKSQTRLSNNTTTDFIVCFSVFVNIIITILGGRSDYCFVHWAQGEGGVEWGIQHFTRSRSFCHFYQQPAGGIK